MGEWDSEMRSSVMVRLQAKHAAKSARLMNVMVAAEKVVQGSRVVGRGVYEITPESFLSLRSSLAAARAFMERNS